jgi:DNA-binding NtrC family response regulator
VGAERTSQVNVRIIAATAQDLLQCIAARSFRNDLYHRLSVLQFTLPPLRDRLADIEPLSLHILILLCARYGMVLPALSEAAISRLAAHAWPGNVRELANVLERALLHSTPGSLVVRAAFLAPAQAGAEDPRVVPFRPRYSFAGNPADEIAVIETALRHCRGNKTRAAELLGMSRNTLLNKLRLLQKTS